MAIFEYIDEKLHAKGLLPEDAAGRARARSIAQYIVSEIQPFQNTRIDSFLADQARHHPPLDSLLVHHIAYAFCISVKFLSEEIVKGLKESLS